MAESGKSGWLGKTLRWLIPLTFSGIAFWLIFRQIEFSQLIGNLKKIGWQTILLAIVFYYLSYSPACSAGIFSCGGRSLSGMHSSP